MNPNQKFTPKYWVVHDKETDDIFPHTMHKSKWQSEEIFAKTLMDTFYGYTCIEEALEAYKENSDTYECILVEIKQVEVEK